MSTNMPAAARVYFGHRDRAPAIFDDVRGIMTAPEHELVGHWPPRTVHRIPSKRDLQTAESKRGAIFLIPGMFISSTGFEESLQRLHRVDPSQLAEEQRTNCLFGVLTLLIDKPAPMPLRVVEVQPNRQLSPACVFELFTDVGGAIDQLGTPNSSVGH